MSYSRSVPRFAANLHYLFTEVPFLERFDCALFADCAGQKDERDFRRESLGK